MAQAAGCKVDLAFGGVTPAASIAWLGAATAGTDVGAPARRCVAPAIVPIIADDLLTVPVGLGVTPRDKVWVGVRSG